jgi:hypothetical protein
MVVAQKVGCDLSLAIQTKTLNAKAAGRKAFVLSVTLLAMLFTGSLRADTYYLTVAGLGGEQEYEQRFNGWAKELEMILKNEPGAKVETLSGAQATRANIQAKLNAIASQAKASDNFVLFMIGHGTFDESDYKFNVPGPDLSATSLGMLLDKIPAQQLIVNMTSASGALIPVIQKPKRVLITATKSGTETNATIFARYFIEALRDPASDSDKNEVITALEAFRYAETKTAKFFEDLKRLATEHALLEDTGKGDGVKTPSSENGQGLIAGRFPLLHTGSSAAVAKDPEKLKLLKRKEEIEAQIDDLKYRKAAMSVPEYRQQLQKYLLELAKTQEALDK